MQHLFWRLNFLLLSGATNSRDMYYEAKTLARELDPRWQQNSKELMTLYAKRSEEHTSELQSLMRISYAVFCLTKKKKQNNNQNPPPHSITSPKHNQYTT